MTAGSTPTAQPLRRSRRPASACTPRRRMPPASRRLVERVRPERSAPGDVLVEITAAAVNPSDVKAAIGLMPYAVFPRTPGRDFAGVVVDGPADLIGKQVFGSSGDLGIRRDGTHATHLVVEADAVVEKPDSMTLDEAAGIGVPFVTALEGFRRAGMPSAGRDGAGPGRQRQGRAGGGADRDLARRPRHRRRAQEPSPTRATRPPPSRSINSSSEDVAGARAGTHRRQGRRHRLQHRRATRITRPAPSRSPSSAGRSSSRRSSSRSSSTSSPSIAAATPMSASIRWRFPRSRRRTCCANWSPASPAATCGPSRSRQTPSTAWKTRRKPIAPCWDRRATA